MRISKWVDLGGEVDIDIDANDIRDALSEAFSRATGDPLGEEPDRSAVTSALNSIAAFLNALTDEQIECLTFAQRQIAWAFLLRQSERFSPKTAIDSDLRLTAGQQETPVSTEPQ